MMSASRFLGVTHGSVAPVAATISNSLRFRANANYLSRVTPSSGGDRDKWYVATWLRRTKFGVVQYLHGADSTSPDAIYFDTSDRLCVDIAGTTRLVSTAVFMDPTAFYHVMVVFDAAHATASQRLRVYVAQTTTADELTAFSTDTRSAITTGTAKTTHNSLGHTMATSASAPGSTGGFEGYISDHRVGTWTGSQPSPAQLLMVDAVTGQVRPCVSALGFGTSGSWAKFDNSSSVANLGLDASGNGNTWTVTGVSLTAGLTYDQVLDTPTNKFATFNPRAVYPANTSNFSNGSMTVTNGSVTMGWSSIALPITGKYYWEITLTTAASSGMNIGIAPLIGNVFVAGQGCYGWDIKTGTKYENGTSVGSAGSAAAGSVIGIIFDADNHTLAFYKNDVLVYTSTSVLAKPYHPIVQSGGTVSTDSITMNHGQIPFTYPSRAAGCLSLNDTNYPDTAVTLSGTFPGSANANGPTVYLGGVPVSMTINGNAVTFGTHARKQAAGVKIITAATTHNLNGTNNYVVTLAGQKYKYGIAQVN